MAKRGRKKGGLKIDPLQDREEITKMIINQANSLNKKIKQFKSKGVTEHMTYLQAFLTDDIVQWTKSDLVSKSKNFYKDKHILWLKKTLSALHKANNDVFYGTVRKYESAVTESQGKVIKYAQNYFRKKGYSEDFINETVNTKQFLIKMIMAFNEGSKSYESNQLIEQVALSYGEDTGLSNAEIDKTLSNIEFSKNTIDRINREMEEFEEWKRLKNKR